MRTRPFPVALGRDVAGDVDYDAGGVDGDDPRRGVDAERRSDGRRAARRRHAGDLGGEFSPADLESGAQHGELGRIERMHGKILALKRAFSS